VKKERALVTDLPPCHREGPPRYYLPVCVLTPLGFMGGPCGYQEVGEDELGRGNVIIVKDSND